MSNDPYNRGAKDSANGLGPANLQNAPATVQQKYNAGYADDQKRQQQKPA